MSDYEYNRQQRELRNNARRLAYAIYSAIGGAWCNNAEHPSVQRLAQMLHYMPEQLVTDAKALEDYTRAKACDDAEAEEDDF